MSWYIFIILSKITDATATIFSKNIFTKKKIDPISFIILYGVITGIATIILGAFLPDFGLYPGKSFPLINIIIMCFLYGFGSVFFYKGIKMVQASRLAIIAASSAVFTLLTSVVIFHENLKEIQYLGSLIIIIGIIVTNYRRGEFKFGKGELFVLIGSALFGTQVVNDKFIMQTMGNYFYIAIAYLAPLLVIVPFFWKSALKVPQTLKIVGVKDILIYCAFLLFQAVTFFIALKMADSPSMVSMFSLCGRVLLVAMSILILKETDNLKQKIFGTIIVIIGLALL